ncbi:hypothetical protein JHK85_043854 [Glycine max]|nr:hypothetical protein JHK85_043854 [Glycine max]
MEFNNNFQFPIKLTATNYPSWYKQVHALLIICDLEGYVTDKIVCPPATIGSGDVAAPNPVYSLWIRQDKLIYLAFLGSCNSEAQFVMAVADTSRDAWVALACAFSNRSQSRIMSIRERLSSITKGTSVVSIHLLSIRNIADELALIGHPIDDLEMVIHTLNSLGPTFREFTASIRTRDSPIAFNELYDKLVDFEMYLQCEECLSTPIPVTTNVVQRYQHGQGRGCSSHGR